MLASALGPGNDTLPSAFCPDVIFLSPDLFWQALLLVLSGVTLMWVFSHGLSGVSQLLGASPASVFRYLPYPGQHYDIENTVFTDCTHPRAPTLTHHKGDNNPLGLKPADTSTGLVLNALRATFLLGGDVYSTAQNTFITTNHFDIDSFLAVWSYVNRQLALQHEAVLRHMARIGDFREAFLSPDLVAAHGPEDGITTIRDAYTALKLCCWISRIERQEFTAPYEEKDQEEKFKFFLPRFAAVLQVGVLPPHAALQTRSSARALDQRPRC